MTKSACLSPDWLERELDEASSDYAMSMPPANADGRLEEADAARLMAKMAARYSAWTGRDLATDLAADKAP